MKERIRRYGKLAIKAVLKEYAQLDNKRIFRPTKASTLTVSQKRNALNLLTIVKFKRNETVKGRACADGRKTTFVHHIERRIDVTSSTIGKYTYDSNDRCIRET